MDDIEVTVMPQPSWVPLRARRSGPLAGYRVLDLSAFAVGPWAASLLATLGADVVKVDPPYGDHIRHVKPARYGEGTTYTVCNLGKRDIELDLKTESHRELVHRLAAECDVVIENSREGAMDRLGVGYAALSAINPAIVYCASSSFGSTGPMATVGSTDPQGQAFSGFVSIQGDDGGDPEFLRYFAAVDLGTSAYLAQAALAGLHHRNRTGRGCVVKTSQMEGALALQTTRIAEHLVAGASPGPLGSGSAAFAPSRAYRCRDSRDIAVSAPDDRAWQRLCTALELPELAADPRFATNRDRTGRRAELDELLERRFATADSTWWRGRLAARGVAHATEQVLDDVMRDTGAALLTERLATVDHPVQGRMRVPGPPWRFARTPAGQTIAPLPGQDTAAFLDPSDTGTDGEAHHRPVPAGTPPAAVGDADLPMSGLKVVEIGQGVATPYCGWLLAALGADVTKAEPPGGDRARHWAPVADGTDQSAAFRALNRGKRLTGLDPLALGSALADADVVIADTALDDYDAEDGGALRERITAAVGDSTVLCWVSEVAPGHPATELEVQALAGLTRYLGSIGEAPVRVGADLATTLAGAFGVQAVLAALIERQTSGRGQTVEVCALDGLLAVLSVMVAALDDPAEWGGFHCLAAAYPRDHGVPTSDGAISFSAPRRSDEAWRALCAELGADAVADDENFRTDAQRTPKSKELNRELAKYTVAFTTATVLEATHRHGGLGVPLQGYRQVFAHPQVEAMDVHDTAGGFDALAAPWRIDGHRPHVGAAPADAPTDLPADLPG
jgi:crotonobetainyl-CoA:carnitine CoA-transferase CaiB-like acyl-CoA transferase